jgi:hypothetical protein
VYQPDDGERFALLVEDKVDAPLQPDQAARYRLRAEKDCFLVIYSDFEIILCAPAYYLSKQSNLCGFDRHISFEKLAEVLRAQDSVRVNYRAHSWRAQELKRTFRSKFGLFLNELFESERPPECLRQLRVMRAQYSYVLG